MGEWLVGVFSVASSVLVTALIFLTKNWISERLRLSIAHEYASELERVRAELVAQQTEAAERLRASIAQQHAIQAAAIGSLTSTHIASHERRLAAIETVWSETVRLREKTPLYVSKAEILLAEEFEEAFRRPDYAVLLERIDEYAESTDLYANRTEVEIARAFCGEYLFSLFFAYRAFTGRVAAQIKSGFKAGRVVCWHDDAHLGEILRAVLTAEELRLVEASRVMRLHNVQTIIERKMVHHITDILSGKAAANANLEAARRITEAVENRASRSGGA
jgi:hypothetical protein